MTWEQQLEQKIEECRAAVKEAESRRVAAAIDEDRAAKALKGYEAALEYERQRNGVQMETTGIGGLLEDAAPVPMVYPPPPPPPPGYLEEVAQNKAGFIRDFIGKHEATGVTPGEIYSAVQEAGINLHRNYVYSVLQRGKAAGTVRVRRGKYFLATESEPS